jgi:hypothetical protein
MKAVADASLLHTALPTIGVLNPAAWVYTVGKVVNKTLHEPCWSGCNRKI